MNKGGHVIHNRLLQLLCLLSLSLDSLNGRCDSTQCLLPMKEILNQTGKYRGDGVRLRMKWFISKNGLSNHERS